MPIEAKSEAPSDTSRIPPLQRAGSASKPERNAALDFTKGALVLLMVFYHWVNYFIGPEWGYYKYLRFLTSSFIFITGFLIANAYLSKSCPVDSSVPKRLLTRGLKLLAVFTGLNVIRTFVAPALGSGVVVRNLFDPCNLFALLVSGNVSYVGGKLASFSILVPISYLLMLSALLAIVHRTYKYTFHVACALLLLSVLLLPIVDMRSPHLECVAIGILGVMAGFIRIETIDRLVRHVYMLAFAYACYAIVITMWDVTFPLLIAGVTLSLMVIYRMGLDGRECRGVRNQIVLLGRYSLFGYISQIAILQILRSGAHRVDLTSGALVVSFLAVVILTITSVNVLDRARPKAAGLDRLYKAVFA